MDAKTGAAKKKSPAELPAGESELLYGMEAIARWLGMTRAQVKPLIDAGVLPTFRRLAAPLPVEPVTTG